MKEIEYKKEQIVKNLDKIIFDFIPELKGKFLNYNFKKKIVDEVIDQLTVSKMKLFIDLPNPILADHICKTKKTILDNYHKEK